MTATDPLRSHLVKLLDWHDAHVDFDRVVKGIPRELQGRTPAGLPHSPWQLLEHLRIAQFDILEFCVNAQYNDLYKHHKWPDDYWPPAAEPPDGHAWTKSVAAYQRDREAMKDLARDTSIDLFARIPHGTGQTYLREILLAADHGAYHVGQLVLVRRALGNWEG